MSAIMQAAPGLPEAFRGVAGQVVTGVSVIVAMAGGEPLATTVGSVVVASWEPPLLAVFLRIGSRMDGALAESGRFTINMLGEADHSLARRFSRPDRGQGWASFSGVPLLRREPSPPVLSRAVAWADCAVVQAIPMGDHCCYAGEVLNAGRDETAQPLAYYRGRFRTLGSALAPTAWATTGIADLTAVW